MDLLSITVRAAQGGILKIISLVEIKHQVYLWTLALTLARMSEINRLKWEDIDLMQRTITLYTRKKKGATDP